MANYLCVFAAPDEHIKFFQEYPDTLASYVEGEKVVFDEEKPKQKGFFAKLFGGNHKTKPLPTTPELWPNEEITMIGPEINHRNVDLYHQILNGTNKPVEGSGSIFQTWLFPGTHSAIEIGEYGEDFAFLSSQISALLDLLNELNVDKVMKNFTLWLRAKGDEYTPTLEDSEEMYKELLEFTNEVEQVVKSKQGLVWISS